MDKETHLNKTLKIFIAFGTRPEAIKMAPLIKEMENCDDIDLVICNTGQHAQMLSDILDFFNISPDYNLEVMSNNQSLAETSAKILARVNEVLLHERPNLVLVHGDTNTTFSVALAAFHNKIKIGHVEAGLRTNNILSPWPEEANRRLTSVITDYHFCPTPKAKINLLREEIQEEKIYICGNTVIDALNLATSELESSKINLKKSFVGFDEVKYEKKILVTGHRRENFGIGFENICSALALLASENPYYQIIYPVHLNPKVQGPVMKMLSAYSNILLVEPQNYQNFVSLMKSCDLILTDSGGIQEEAPTLGKPLVVMRDNTERPEVVENGNALLVGNDRLKIVSAVNKILSDPVIYDRMSSASNPYGDGTAALSITKIICNLEF